MEEERAISWAKWGSMSSAGMSLFFYSSSFHFFPTFHPLSHPRARHLQNGSAGSCLLRLLWAPGKSASLEAKPKTLTLAFLQSSSQSHWGSDSKSLHCPALPSLPLPQTDTHHLVSQQHITQIQLWERLWAFWKRRSSDHYSNCLKTPTVKYNMINRMDRSPAFVSGIEKKKHTQFGPYMKINLLTN